MTEGACLKCEGPIPASRRADSRYCSDGCKRAAEFERRRIQRRLTQLESAERQWRCWPGYEHHLAHVQGEIRRAEARLRLLLDG
jgi:hypothetical protein